MPHRRSGKRPHPLTLVAFALPALLLQACGGGGGGGESRETTLASIPEECRFLGGEAFGLTDEELREVRDAGCLASPGGETTASPESVPEDDDTVAGPVPETDTGGAAELPLVTAGGVPSTGGDAGPADVDGSSFLITGNNSARLTGAAFGSGIDSSAALRRSVPFRLEVPSADFEIEAAHVVGTGEFFYVLVVVTSRANATLCDVDLGAVGVVDAAGDVRFEPNSDLFGLAVEGSAARAPSGRLHTRCLAPGESSYAVLFSPDDMVADEVVSISVPQIVTDDTSVSPPMTRLLPTGYTIAEDSGNLTVTIRNDGLIDVESGYVVVIVLDEAGYPLAFTNDFAETIVPAGGEAAVVFPGFRFFSGRADTIRVIVGYNDVR